MPGADEKSTSGDDLPIMTQAEAIPSVSVAQVLGDEGAVVIDLRSPKEFAEDHLPGANNVPLFDDLERELIGTLFAKASPERAFDEGLRRTRAGVQELVAEIGRVVGWEAPRVDLRSLVDDLAGGGMERMQAALKLVPTELPERPVVLHCWRGGMRSRSVTALVRGLGLRDAVLLEGGYKSYRRAVLERLDAFVAPPAFVLRGLTGVGKTLVLRALEELQRGSTLDLELAAGHRSSILGMVGLVPVSQKLFDSRLMERLGQGFPAGWFVLEGESRKVGDSIVPASIWRALRIGTPLELVAPMETRVENLIGDYLAQDENRDHLARQLPFIEERLGPKKWRGVLVQLLADGREEELVEVLLERYYDPLYEHSEKRFLGERAAAGLPAYAARFDTNDPETAARAIQAWIEEHQSESTVPGSLSHL